MAVRNEGASLIVTGGRLRFCALRHGPGRLGADALEVFQRNAQLAARAALMSQNSPYDVTDYSR